jgi:hypothetical protein
MLALVPWPLPLWPLPLWPLPLPCAASRRGPAAGRNPQRPCPGLQIDGCASQEGEERQHVVVLAATNFEWQLDEALR